ncbi:GNAT family N-acetyltransferase [Ferrimonas marina]|uniref:Acetyltransferase (GNAT) family protein n=1 Tax=Ferrimonas marina TaxID=299255 RepID=A0A1M5VX78_9GAMM|nr:GNAT family N-acetyltransferase [Ferrimonas marina]SHH79808.1 Acetyltransferase (GNAT) family protein [Ferrimonas marina]
MSLSIRPLTELDWPGVMALQREAYGETLVEPKSVLQSKQRLGPQSCWGVWRDECLLAYCLAHPWPLGTPPPLGQVAEADAGKTMQMYLHDMAVSPQARGLGVAKALLEQLEDGARAQGFSHLALVAVAGADGYWRRHGFTRQRISKCLADYGEGARYKVKPL